MCDRLTVCNYVITIIITYVNCCRILLLHTPPLEAQTIFTASSEDQWLLPKTKHSAINWPSIYSAAILPLLVLVRVQLWNKLSSRQTPLRPARLALNDCSAQLGKYFAAVAANCLTTCVIWCCSLEIGSKNCYRRRLAWQSAELTSNS